MPKMQTITLQDGGGTIEVDTEACSQFGFEAGDQIAPEEHMDKPATVLGAAPIPEGLRCDCVNHSDPVLWVRSQADEICIVPQRILETLKKV